LDHFIPGYHDGQYEITDSSGVVWHILSATHESDDCTKTCLTAHHGQTGAEHNVDAFSYGTPTQKELVLLADAGWPQGRACHDLLRRHREKVFADFMQVAAGGDL
jgi:hypothetical protein